MDDLISRQDAIDALGDKPETWNDTDYELGQVAQWNYDRTAIARLPSAQPIDVQEAYYRGKIDGIKGCTARLKKVTEEFANGRFNQKV